MTGMTRRKILELGALALPATAAAATTSPLHASEKTHSAQSLGEGFLFKIEGLGVLVLAGSETKPSAAALVFTSPDGLTVTRGNTKKTLPRHYPTLGIPRDRISPMSTAEPVAVTPHMVFYSLAGQTMRFVVRTKESTDEESQVVSAPFSASTERATTCQPTAATWNSLDWLPKIARDLKKGVQLPASWRSSRFIDGIVFFEAGVMEDARLHEDSFHGRTYTVPADNNATRYFKESVRHLLSAKGHLHISLTPRSGGGQQKSIVVSAPGPEPTEISLTQLPRPADMRTLDDVLSYLGLFDETETLLNDCLAGGCQLPYRNAGGCADAGGDPSSFGCDCCPVGLAVDPSWQ